MKQLSHDTLTNSSASEIIATVQTGKYSVLKSVNANYLRLEMLLVGYICRFVLWLILMTPPRRYKRANHLLSFFFPTTIKQDRYFPSPKRKINAAVVILFNHQSLFEVLAAISYCLSNFSQKNYIFPVNLPWYECLAPVSDQLSQLGIEITPIITIRTYGKLAKRNPQDIATIDRLRRLFISHYLELVGQYASSSNIIAFAPSATREPTMFPTKQDYHSGSDANIESKATTGIILAIQRAINRGVQMPQIDFVFAACVPRTRTRRGLNIGRRHNIYIDKALTMPQMLRLLKLKKVDFVARRKLAQYLPEHIKYPPIIKAAN